MEALHVLTFPRNRRLWPVFYSLVAFTSTPFVQTSEEAPELKQAVDSWQNTLSFLIVVFLQNDIVAALLKGFGDCLEALLNLHRVNGGLTGIGWKLVTFNCRGIVTNLEDLPLQRWSMIKLLDPRDNLYDPNPFSTGKPHVLGLKKIADACMMASKLAYENTSIIRDTIETKWKMHVECLEQRPNRYEPKNTTQLLIFTDTEEAPKAIVVAFRGTQFFNSYDWSTDFDFAFYEFSNVGGVHVGFLEALGVVTRQELQQRHMLQKGRISKHLSLQRSDLPELDEKSAFFVANLKLKELLKKHKDAKVYVTGHSLGGALAVVFCGLLFAYAKNDEERDELTERIDGVYTFGQPRAGNMDFACYMDRKLRSQVYEDGAFRFRYRYFRVVHSNDIVPRVPFDDFNFRFKHFGLCFFFNSFYLQETCLDEPNKNFFSPWAIVRARVMAYFELLQSFLLPMYGSGYRETWTSTGFRCFGLLFPGLADHSPVDYVNAVRLGPEVLTQRGSLERLFDEIKNNVSWIIVKTKNLHK